MTTPVSKLRKQVLPQREDTRDLDERGPTAVRESLRPLCRREIDRRIDRLTGEVASVFLTRPTPYREGPAPRPRWVNTREFVERMRQFLVYN